MVTLITMLFCFGCCTQPHALAIEFGRVQHGLMMVDDIDGSSICYWCGSGGGDMKTLDQQKYTRWPWALGKMNEREKKNKINEKHNVQQPCSSCSMCSNQFIPDLKASTKCWNVVVVAFAGAVELATIYTYGEREWERVEQIHITRVLS